MKFTIFGALAGAVLLAGCSEPSAEEPAAEDAAVIEPAPDGDTAVAPEPAETIGPVAYACEPAMELSVVYLNPAGAPGQARVTLDGTRYVLDQVLSGSGARYLTEAGRSPGATLVWWSKGTGGMLLEGRTDDPDAEETALADCTEAG